MTLKKKVANDHNMKKVALCLFGQPRFYKAGYEYLKQFLNNPEYKTHVFFHTWWSEDVVGTYYDASPWGFIQKSGMLIRDNTVEELLLLYDPKRYTAEKQIIFTSEIDFSSHSSRARPEILYSQSYSRQATAQLKKEYEDKHGFKYDIVINTRFDIRVNPLDLLKLEPNKIYAGIGPNFVNTTLFNESYIIYVGLSDDHTALGNLVDNFIMLFGKGIQFCSEAMIHAYAIHCNILDKMVKSEAIDSRLIRGFDQTGKMYLG